MWFQDEARIGQKNGLVRIWAKKGTRPRLPADQRYTSAYLFGAICPARGAGAALMLPWANTHAMQLHLDQISKYVARKAHGVLLMDRAGWHTTSKLKVPKNLTIILLPLFFSVPNQQGPLPWTPVAAAVLTWIGAALLSQFLAGKNEDQLKSMWKWLPPSLHGGVLLYLSLIHS